MTREEAINIISQMVKDEEGFLSDNTVEAHKMAIKALEQEPSGDCISRQAVHILIHELEEALVYEKNYISRERDATTIIEDILALPPVTPQQNTGHWILTSDDDYEYCTCSECGYQNGENWMIGSQIKFCQECGAKMVDVPDTNDGKLSEIPTGSESEDKE